MHTSYSAVHAAVVETLDQPTHRSFLQCATGHTCCRRNARRRNRCCDLASMLDSQAGNLNCGGGGSPAAARASSKRLTSCSRCFSVSAADHHAMSIGCFPGPWQLQP